MKNNYYILIILLLITGTFTACKKIAYDSKFDKSYQKWLDFKKSANNSYRYETLTSSWTGYSTKSTITVRAGKVVGRSYLAQSIADQQTNAIKVEEEWTEDEGNLNSHPRGFNTITLDEIYQKAKNDWLLKRKDAKTYFETENNGMLSSCGYVSNGCMDDCFTGIYISSIVALD